MPGRGWEDRDIVAGDDIFHHRAAADVFYRKIRGPGFGCVKHASPTCYDARDC
jgi:hypothetical protein